MKEFTNFSKKALATANVITVEQFLFISDVIHNSEGGFYSAALHKGKRYMAITLYGDKCNPRYTYYVVDLINMTAEQVDSIQQAKQMISEIVSKGGKKATDMSTNSAVSIPRPSCDEVDKYLHKWNTTPDLYEPDAVLNELFTKTLPYNRSIDDIILKAATLNTVYNTRITSIYPIAQHILSLGIDARLRVGDETLVQELMSVDYAGTGDHIDHYSLNAAKVDAQYSAQLRSMYVGNPWIETLPDNPDDKELFRSLRGKIPYDASERELPAYERRECIQSLSQVFVPWGKAGEIARKIVRNSRRLCHEEPCREELEKGTGGIAELCAEKGFWIQLCDWKQCQCVWFLHRR
jgi:hypothetical protein